MTRHQVWSCDFCKVTAPDTDVGGWTEYDVFERVAGDVGSLGSYTVCPTCIDKQPDQTKKGFLRRILSKIHGGE